MKLFKEVEDATAVITVSNLHLETKVFRKGNLLYAQHGKGFVGLYNGKQTTTHPKINMVDIVLPFEPTGGKFGHLMSPIKYKD